MFWRGCGYFLDLEKNITASREAGGWWLVTDREQSADFSAAAFLSCAAIAGSLRGWRESGLPGKEPSVQLEVTLSLALSFRARTRAWS